MTRLLTAIFVLLLAISLGGCSDSTTEPPTAGSIVGQLLGTSAPGATITLSREGRVEATATADAPGTFRFDGLSPAGYEVSVGAPEGFRVLQVADASRRVVVGSGGVHEVVFHLASDSEEFGTLDVTAATATGDPVAGIQIFVELLDDGSGEPPDTSEVSDASAVTDADGLASIPLLPGIYAVYATPPPGYGITGVTPEPITITGGVTTNLAIEARPTWIPRNQDPNLLIFALAEDDSVSGVLVTFADASAPGDSLISALTFAGKAALELPPGSYTVAAHAPFGYGVVSLEPQSVVIVEDGEVQVVRVELEVIENPVTGTVAVEAWGDGQPLEAVGIRLESTMTYGPLGFTYADSTGEDGRASLSVPPGTYRLSVQAPSGWNLVSANYQMIEVFEAQETLVTLQFEEFIPPPLWNVLVTATDGVTGVPGTWIEFAATGAAPDDTLGFWSAVTDSIGEARVLLGEGSWTVSATAPVGYDVTSISPESLEITDIHGPYSVRVLLEP